MNGHGARVVKDEVKCFVWIYSSDGVCVCVSVCVVCALCVLCVVCALCVLCVYVCVCFLSGWKSYASVRPRLNPSLPLRGLRMASEYRNDNRPSSGLVPLMLPRCLSVLVCPVIMWENSKSQYQGGTGCETTRMVAQRCMT